jgi:hypothetical protein
MTRRHTILALGAALLAAGGISWVLAGGNLVFRISSGAIVETKWDERQMPVKFFLSTDGFPSSGITNEQLVTEMDAALATFQNLPASTINFAPVALGAGNSTGGDSAYASGLDGRNVVTFTDPTFVFSPSVLAVCSHVRTNDPLVITDDNADIDGDGVRDMPNGTYPPGTMLDADVIFDGTRPWSLTGGGGTFDIRQVAMHEFGHCIGMSHSSIPGATMWPVYNLDLAAGRQLKTDDIAIASRIYPQAPQYAQSYGTIRGRVISGISSQSIRGAHVFAAHVTTRAKIVGAYTLDNGEYELAVPTGSYLVGIEPLDGEPPELEPERINSIIANTSDVRFPEEYYDSAESSLDDPQAAAQVTVAAGAVVNAINLTTNMGNSVRSSLEVRRGINYISYPVAVGAGLRAYQVLQQLAAQGGINSIERYNPDIGEFQRALMLDGVPRGHDFPLKRGEGYILHSTAPALLSFQGSADCPAFNLSAGLNLIGAPCAPAGYSAYDLLLDIGEPTTVIGVQRFSPQTGTFEVASFTGNQPTGVDFPVEEGGAYIVELYTPRTGFRINRSGQAFVPQLNSVSPGEGVRGAIITLNGVGFDPVPNRNVVLFNAVFAEVIEGTTQQLVVRVPTQATSGTVKAVVNSVESNTLPFFVVDSQAQVPEGAIFDVVSGQQLNATLDSVEDVDLYRFLAVAGNRVSITAQPVSGSQPVLEVTLSGPAGGILAGAESRSTGRAMIRDFPLEAAGYHTVAVRAAADGGTGPYRIRIDLTGTPSAPEVQIIGGNYQTGVSGTELPHQVEIVAVGGSGLPASQVPISINVEAVENPTGLIAAQAREMRFTEAATTQLVTTRAGNLAVRVQLPSGGTGDFRVVVSAPGMTPAILYVAAIDRPIARVEITPSEQETCGGQGCIVGQRIATPYSMRYFDSDDAPVAGVISQWAVASGNGSLEPGVGAIPCSGIAAATTRCTKSGADGRVTMFHRLGTRLAFEQESSNPTDSGFDPNAPLIRIPQQVVATLPGAAAPVVFSALSRSADPARIYTLNSPTQRISLGVIRLGLIKLLVLDEYGNPVGNEPVTLGGLSAGIVRGPGFIDGAVFDSPQTDLKGLWSVGIGAIVGQARPTMNEFGFKGVPGTAAPYTISVSVPRTGTTSSVTLDVDMGPEFPSTGATGVHALIGEIAPPVTYLGRRYQRLDSDDEDGGDWTNDPGFLLLRTMPMRNVPMALTYRRQDQRYLNESGHTPTMIGGALATTRSTNNAGNLTINDVRMGSVFGRGTLVATIPTRRVVFLRTIEGNPFVDDEISEALGFRDFEFPSARVIPINANPVLLTLDLQDPGPTAPSPDPYPTIAAASGVNPADVIVNLNDADVFAQYRTGTQSVINVFPNYGRVRLDNVNYAPGTCPAGGACLPVLRPQQFTFTYHPSLEQLRSGFNDVSVSLRDGAKNAPEAIECRFTKGNPCN